MTTRTIKKFNIITGVSHKDITNPMIGERHIGKTRIKTVVYFNEQKMVGMIGNNRVYIPDLGIMIYYCTVINSQLLLNNQSSYGLILHSYYTNPRRVSVSK